MSEEEVAFGILAGWPRCQWCDKPFNREGYTLCSDECNKEQWYVWRHDFDKWKMLYNRFEKARRNIQ